MHVRERVREPRELADLCAKGLMVGVLGWWSLTFTDIHILGIGWNHQSDMMYYVFCWSSLSPWQLPWPRISMVIPRSQAKLYWWYMYINIISYCWLYPIIKYPKIYSQMMGNQSKRSHIIPIVILFPDIQNLYNVVNPIINLNFWRVYTTDLWWYWGYFIGSTTGYPVPLSVGIH